MQDTLKKFRYPGSLVKEYDHWFVLLRPAQVTLGSLILFEKSGAHRFSNISQDSFLEFGTVVSHVDRVLADEFRYDKLNYLMLMMVDPEVHFHLIPRYSEDRHFGSITFKDYGWPALPELGRINDVPDETMAELVTALRQKFSRVTES